MDKQKVLKNLGAIKVALSKAKWNELDANSVCEVRNGIFAIHQLEEFFNKPEVMQPALEVGGDGDVFEEVEKKTKKKKVSKRK